MRMLTQAPSIDVGSSEQRWLAKPDWVRREVRALDEALNGRRVFGQRRRAVCCVLAAHFNRLHASHGMRLRKTFVAQVLADRRLRELQVRNDFKHRVPIDVPCNAVWAMDATWLASTQGDAGHATAMGIVDHGSRLLSIWPGACRWRFGINTPCPRGGPRCTGGAARCARSCCASSAAPCSSLYRTGGKAPSVGQLGRVHAIRQKLRQPDALWRKKQGRRKAVQRAR